MNQSHIKTTDSMGESVTWPTSIATEHINGYVMCFTRRLFYHLCIILMVASERVELAQIRNSRERCSIRRSSSSFQAGRRRILHDQNGKLRCRGRRPTCPRVYFDNEDLLNNLVLLLVVPYVFSFQVPLIRCRCCCLVPMIFDEG